MASVKQRIEGIGKGSQTVGTAEALAAFTCLPVAVSTLVNNPRNDVRDCLQPLTAVWEAIELLGR